jgi:hypothetical protein
MPGAESNDRGWGTIGLIYGEVTADTAEDVLSL